ncbi:hypothetical protein QJQ45_023763 [Haematococcus lacustris]|nr:hypothetical protein QJQ45_023763 [Haematococcus lacustris]
MSEFVFDPATQIGVGIDPGVTQAVSAASGVWDERSGQLVTDQLAWWKLTKGQVKHASGLSNSRRDTERWLAPIKPHLQHLAAASSAGTSLVANLKHITVTLATWDAVWEVHLDPKWAWQRLRLYVAQDRALEQFFKKLKEEMAEMSMKRHGRAKQLVVFFNAASIGTGGGWGADAVLRACCKVVCRPSGTDQLRGRVVLVDEHRTSRVSSAVNGQQPCEEELDHEQPTRPADWKPPAGQVEHRLLRPAWSQQRDQPVRGMMWSPVVAPRKPPQSPRSSQAATQPAASEPGPSTPQPAKRTKADQAAEPTQPTKAAKAKPAPQPGRWVDRDCNAALNMQHIGESRWRALELCYWPEQRKLPVKGKEYPEPGYKRLRDKPSPKAQQYQQQPAAAMPLVHGGMDFSDQSLLSTRALVVLARERRESMSRPRLIPRDRPRVLHRLRARPLPKRLEQELMNSCQLVPDDEAAVAAHAVGLPHIGKGIAEMSEFVFDPATQIGVGIDPGVTQAVSAASGVWDERSGQLVADQLARWKLTKGQVNHASGLNNSRRDTERWLAPIKPHLQHLTAASSAGTSLVANLKHITVTLATWDAVWEVHLDPKWAWQRLRLYIAQDRALEQFFKKLKEEMAEMSMKRHGRAKQLVVFFNAASIGTGGGWGADAVLRACCKVVCRPSGTDQLRGRVVLVDEHRTTRVSSAVNGQQPCEEELDHEQPTRPADWKPPAGQVEHRLLRPAWSQQRDQPVRGMMWSPLVAPRKPPQPPRSSQAATQPAASEPGPSTPPPAKRSKRTKADQAAEPTQPTKAAKAYPAPQPGRWVNRDCNAALNMQRIGEAKWRPLELCYWPEQGKLPAKGKEYPELGYKRLRDKPPKAQQQQQQPAAAQSQAGSMPTQPTTGKGKAAKAKPAQQPGRWVDGDCNAALNMQRIGESKWCPLELCYWPEHGKLPAKGKEYPGLGYKRLRDKPPKAQQQQQPPAAEQSYRTPPALMAKLTTGASRQSSLAQDSTGERARRLLAAVNAYMKVKRGQSQPSMAAVAREHGVPYTTLHRVIKRGGVIAKRGRPTALSAVEEEQLRDLVVRGQQQGVGVTKTALLAAVRTTQRVTERKGKVDPFKGKAPGKKWRQGFMRRQGLSLRKATPVTKNRRSAVRDSHGLADWFDKKWQPALSRVCVSKDAAGRRVQPQTYKQRPDRIFNMDETGFQAECHERVLAITGAKHVFQSAAANSRRSYTCVAWGSADGCVMPPNFVYAGKQLSHNALGAIHFYPQSSIILKEGTHMMDGRLFPKLLDVMAKQIPGGVSPTNRALLVLDGHASRFSNDTKEAARVHGFDLVILPAQCTSFLQPWDQLFGSVKAQYQKLLGQAAFLADG